MTKSRTVNIPIIARVEGEGALDLEIRKDKIEKLHLRIYEPPRLFEKFLEGRSYNDVIDMVARICGLCPVAYQMSAAHAIESIFNLEMSPWVRAMRRVFYCGEWLENHSIHMHFLALPDFLGFNSLLEMAKKYPDEVRRGMRIQALGYDIMKLFAARSVNPVGACVGGFYCAPSKKDVSILLERLSNAVAGAKDLVRWIASLSIPDNSHDFISVALHHDNEYPMNEGRLISDHGLNISIDQFGDHFTEKQVPHSTALHCTLEGSDYMVGPIARLNLNFDRMPEQVKKLASEIDLKIPTKNMFDGIHARAIEIYYAILEAIRILENYEPTKEPFQKPELKAGVGFGCTEAPRGILWHRYEMDEKGCVKSARIVPPTSQNQSRIEEDLKTSLHNFGLDHGDDELRHYSEMIIRNYDPCISCSTHFLDMRVKRDKNK